MYIYIKKYKWHTYIGVHSMNGAATWVLGTCPDSSVRSLQLKRAAGKLGTPPVPSKS